MFLSIYVIGLILSLIGGDYASVRATVGHPCNAVLLSAFLIASFWHARLGMQVIIEDYVHTPGLAMASQLAVVFVCVLAALASVLAVIRIALGA
ncbi:succinate dehydrogenase, hydrophobic membrane anchor protein [compost metagenome]